MKKKGKIAIIRVFYNFLLQQRKGAKKESEKGDPHVLSHVCRICEGKIFRGLREITKYDPLLLFIDLS